MTIQNGMPPYPIRCLTCGQSWEPPPASSGPNKGTVTDSTIEKSTRDHVCALPPTDDEIEEDSDDDS